LSVPIIPKKSEPIPQKVVQRTKRKEILVRAVQNKFTRNKIQIKKCKTILSGQNWQ